MKRTYAFLKGEDFDNDYFYFKKYIVWYESLLAASRSKKDFRASQHIIRCLRILKSKPIYQQLKEFEGKYGKLKVKGW